MSTGSLRKGSAVSVPPGGDSGGAGWSQRSRVLAIRTKLGDEALALRALVLSEGVSVPYLLTARVTPTGAGDGGAATLIGTDVSIRVNDHAGVARHLTGVVVRVTRPAIGATGARTLSSVDLSIVPRLWLATRHIDCKIFQDRTVLEIVGEVLGRYGVRLEVRCKDRYAPHTYCVQYRESDFHFVSRLLEHHGIAYHFEHTQDHQAMVLTDSPAQFPDVLGNASVPFGALDSHDRETSMARWWSESSLQSAGVVLSEYDYVKPSADLRAARALAAGVTGADAADVTLNGSEVYDWRAQYSVLPEGERLARLRAEELAAGAEVFKGVTHLRTPRAGHVFALTDPTGVLSPGFEGRYLVRAVTLVARADDYDDAHALDGHAGLSGLSSGPGSGLVGAVEHACPVNAEHVAMGLAKGAPIATTFIDAQRAEVPFRPARTHAKPTVAGPQTAVVTGAGGEEIHTDKYGRVKVKFRWDRHGPVDQRSSCWLRSAQAWAGKGWGGIQIPRIGQEVIVDFIEGDPDEPIITGRVYNAESMPPVSGAGRDPKKGETNPKDMMEAAMQTSMRSNSLGGSGGHNEITMHDAGGGEKLFIRAQKDEVHLVQNDRTDTVGHDETRDVGNDRTRTVGNNEAVTIGVNETRSVGTNQTISVGSNIKITAGDSITLECGLSKLTMNSAGVISLTGTMITVAGMANVNVAAPLTNIAGAAMLNLLGAFTTVTGSTVKITGSSLASVSGGKLDLLAPGNDLIIKGEKVQIN